MVEQGEIIRVEGIEWPCVVVSKNQYNKSDHVIVCPITKQKDATLGYKVSVGNISGFVQCDNLRMFDLTKRHVLSKDRVSMFDMIQILSRVNALFDII